MPRDKSLSHQRVNKAIMEEFLEKGYEGASIRSIGARAGMTSAGLYRHYADKEAMFEGMVQPLVDEMKSWLKNHTNKRYDIVDGDLSQKDLFGESFVDLIRDVILPRRQEFILLMTCSGGTKYENFIHDLTEEKAYRIHIKEHFDRNRMCLLPNPSVVSLWHMIWTNHSLLK